MDEIDEVLSETILLKQMYRQEVIELRLQVKDLKKQIKKLEDKNQRHIS
jgi:polyhydroxyalkanoate synthesis regulator phasin